MPTAESTAYLRAVLMKKQNPRKEVNAKISKCMYTVKQLQHFWNNPNCPTKFKLQVFDAVIRSKLVYGLESLELTAGNMSHLNAFQLKGLRRIFKIQTTYIVRANTNQKVFDRANSIANPTQIPGKHIRSFSDYIHTQQGKLLAHTVRAPISDPLHQSTLTVGTHYPYEYDKRRVGRPRSNWTHQTYVRMIKNNIPYIDDTLKKNPKMYMDQLLPSILDRSVKL
jgi:hypothetical protein